MADKQSVVIGGLVLGGVLIYAAISDSTVWSVLTGGSNPVDDSESDGTDTGTEAGDPGNVSDSESISPTGLRGAVVQAAQSGLSIKSGYAETRPMPGSLSECQAGAETDCSGFATLCYKQAGAPDPNGLGYNGQGYTGTLEAHGKKVQNPEPGDLHFWQSPDHVAVDVGNGSVIGWGSDPGPVEDTIEAESGYHKRYLGARSYLPQQADDTNLSTGNNPRGTAIQ